MSKLIQTMLTGFCASTLLAVPAARSADTADNTDNDKRVAVLKGLYMDHDQHPATVGARYHILLEGKDGKRSEVPTTYAFKTGDRFWLRMEVRTPVYVYVLNRTLGDKDKGIAMVRHEDTAKPPARELQPRLVYGPEKVDPGEFQMVPKGVALKFNEQPGVEKLYVVLAEKPVAEIERQFQNGELKPGTSNLRSLNKSLERWNSNATYAVPDAGDKGFSRDEPAPAPAPKPSAPQKPAARNNTPARDANGYCVERKHGEPVMLEITLNHS